MDFFYRICLLILCALGTGCVSNQHDWGNYSTELYQYYKSPAPEQRAQFQEELASVFERVESKGLVPAPGLYAEYGTLLMESEDYSGAIEYFQKEKAAWPESSTLMDALITSLNRQGPQPDSESTSLEEGSTDE